MTPAERVPADSDLADIFPYSRAVKKGNLIEIAGSGACDGDQPVAPGDLFEQTRFIYQKLEAVLHRLGSSFDDVVKITIFLLDVTKWPDVARAHKLFFEEIKPAVTLIEVSALIDPAMEIEIEATAVVESG